MTTGQYMLRLVARRPVEFCWNIVAWAVFHLIPLAYALIVRAIFDELARGSAAGAKVWTLLVILAVAYASR